jgi:DNA excision repair protein ERCC-4
MVIVRDTREQAGYTFATITPPPQVITGTLKSGDYSIQGYENQVSVERKSLIDAFGTFGNGRHRFEAELKRLSEYRFAAVVIEADWQTIIKNPPWRSKLLPKTVLASVIAWQMRFNVHFWACPDRNFAEKLTYRILDRFYRDQQEERWQKTAVAT